MKNTRRISINRNIEESAGPERFFQHRRALVFLGAAGFLNLLVPFPRFCFASLPEECFPPLLDLSRLEPLQEPLFIFRDYEDEPDQEIKAHIMKGIANSPDLLEKLRNKTGFDRRVSVTFERLEIRLLFVPELRNRYADAYKRYSADVIDYAVDKTKLDNPYLKIVNPLEQYPEIPQEGITAFTVHQLGKEYRAVCILTAEDGRSVKCKIEGAVFSNHLGAVALHIECPQEAVFCLRRNNYSIWQNRPKNLYTLLSIPVEETLHFILGQYTDRKIEQELRRGPALKVSEVENLANHWMAVEEAMVGGLVHTLLPDFLRRKCVRLSSFEKGCDIKKKTHLSQYRFLKTGIVLVEKLGYQRAIDIFKGDPAAFSRLLVQA
jgi:hypothetical protein